MSDDKMIIFKDQGTLSTEEFEEGDSCPSEFIENEEVGIKDEDERI